MTDCGAGGHVRRRSRRPRSSAPDACTSAPGFASASRAPVNPYRAAYSRSDGSSPDAIRSRWMRSAITTSASRSASSIEEVTWNRRPAAAPRPAHASNPRSSVDGPHSHRSAPAAVSVQMLERATRECSTSPRITTLRPAIEPPSRERIVYRSSSAWVGWACQPSPPLSTEPPNTSAARYGAPAHAVAHHEHLRAERLDRPDGVDQRLALRHRRGRCRDVHDVRRQVLGRDLERDAGPRRRLVEQDRHVPTAQRRDLGDRPRQDLAHRVGRAHDEVEVGGRQAVDVEQMAMAPADRLRFRGDIDGRDDDLGRRRALVDHVGHATGSAASGLSTRRSISTPSSPSVSSRCTLHDLLARGRHVLADVVGPDRQLAMAAVDEHGQADRLGPPEVDQRVHRGPDRATRCTARRRPGRPSARRCPTAARCP